MTSTLSAVEPTVEEADAAKAAGRGPRLDASLGWLLTVLAFVVGARTISDNSFLTHFTTGDIIRVRGGVPTVDPYSWTAPGEPWTVQSWFASYLYSLANVIGGGAAIRILNGVLTAFLAAVVWRLTDRAPSLLARVTTAGVVITIGGTMWTPRPLLFGLAGIAVLLLVLDERLSLMWIVPVMWVWVNTHGSFPLAIILVGATGLGAMIDQRRFPAREARVLGVVAAGTLLGALNPLGLRLLTFPVELLGNREALDGVAEWARPGFDRPVEWLFLVLVVGSALGATRRMPWRHVVPAAVFALTGFMAVRNIGVAAMVMAPVVAGALVSLPSTLRGSDRSFLSRALAVVTGTMLVLSTLFVITTAPLDLRRFPVEAIDYMEDEQLIAVEDARILQRDRVGNYLHLRFGTESRVFMDDRFDFYPSDVLVDHTDLIRGANLDDIIERRRPTAILWDADSDLADWVRDSTEWQVVYEDDDAIVAVPL